MMGEVRVRGGAGAGVLVLVRGDKGVVIRSSSGRGDEEKCCAGAVMCGCCAVRMLILMAMLVLVLGVAVTRAW
jgi:hypothetical protein